jgi:hypothetical protein
MIGDLDLLGHHHRLKVLDRHVVPQRRPRCQTKVDLGNDVVAPPSRH